MRFALTVGFLGLSLVAASATNTVSSWTGIFKGIEQATGTNEGGGTVALSVNALRIDLRDPDVRLFVTPPASNYVANSRETLLQTPREFVIEHGLSVAINSGQFTPAGYDRPSGTPAVVEGLAISQGVMVSEQTNPNESLSALLFRTNNEPTLIHVNWPATTNLAGVFNAVSGMYPLVSNGVNVAFGYTNSSSTIHRRQPRTAFGLSEDNRYLIWVTIDGRQQDFSDGALDWETADFLLLYGAWQGMNLDGGGSTCMVKATECGPPEDINQNSYQFAVGRPGSQRPVGCNLGVWAPPLGPIRELAVTTAATTATVTWRTDMEATTQVEYGLTPAYGSTTPLDSQPRKSHVATLSGLALGSNYYYRVISMVDTQQFSFACQFSNIISLVGTRLISLTNSWKFTTNNLDGVNWTAPGYDDTNWLGEGPALLHMEASTLVAPKNTVLPPGVGQPISQPIPRTYYFRTHFEFAGETPSGLIFSNYIDDGAVFYVNGAEVRRLRVPAAPTAITNNTPANGSPCAGTAQAGDAATQCPDVFVVSGNLLTNLVQGDNVIAVEVHNVPTANDLVFGSALIALSPTPVVPQLHLLREANLATLYWTVDGFTLQQSPDLSSWADVPGPAGQSPVTLTNSASVFYRLRN